MEIGEEVKPTVCGILPGIEGGRFSHSRMKREKELELISGSLRKSLGR